ncbi:MAG: YutD family protein [Lactobacillus sp.]|nr:YutD family protein [Lactobacillus sp.]MDN6052730.1 YutD family protein [Lactobacillus sp.]
MTEHTKTTNKFKVEQPVRHNLAVVEQTADKLKINEQLYQVLVNQGAALDLTLLAKKYDPYLDQYDFIVGDVASDHLRLKGFYQAEAHLGIDKSQLAIVDYLTEYCNPGGGYFVLKLLTPVHTYQQRRRRPNHKWPSKRRSRPADDWPFAAHKVHQNKIKPHSHVLKQEHSAHHAFVIKKRGNR